MKKCIQILFVLLVGIIYAVSTKTAAAEESKEEAEILFTHDLHSHLEEFVVEYDGVEQKMGGFARIRTIIDDKKAENENLLYVDAGDFSMGTLFQTIFSEEASELRMLGMLGCEATTLGNHEFDYRASGFLSMLENAKESGDAIPEILLCNAKPGSGEYKDFECKPYKMVTKGNIKIALLGVFGKDALDCAPTCTLEFEDPVKAVKETVAKIKENEQPDLIVCLSHSGTNKNKKNSEDEILAKEVPDLDVIVSGHTHTLLEEPIIVGNTYVVSTGAYGSRIGNIKLERNEKGRWTLVSYELIPVFSDISEEAQTKAKIEEFRSMIDSVYLEPFGYSMEQVLTNNPWKFSPLRDYGHVLREEPLGNIITDAYVASVKKAEGDAYVPVDIAILPSGIIRDTLPTGDVTVEDAFNILSLGIGADGVPGYPLISVYLTGKELKTVAEIDASISPFMSTAELYCSGVEYSINTKRLILNKVTDAWIINEDGKQETIDDNKLYRVIADLYSGQMLSSVTSMSYGILSVVPKDKTGEPIKDFETCIIKDGNRELKAWVSLADYLNSFDEIPEYYSGPQGRKQITADANPVAVLKNPNRFALAMYSIIAFFVFVVVLVILLLLRKIRRRKMRRKLNGKTQNRGTE